MDITFSRLFLFVVCFASVLVSLVGSSSMVKSGSLFLDSLVDSIVISCDGPASREFSDIMVDFVFWKLSDNTGDFVFWEFLDSMVDFVFWGFSDSMVDFVFWGFSDSLVDFVFWVFSDSMVDFVFWGFSDRTSDKVKDNNREVF